MDEPEPSLSLPGLQRLLDSLDVGGRLTIPITDYRRLFGANQAAQARIQNFAVGHGCTYEAQPTALTFHKVRMMAN